VKGRHRENKKNKKKKKNDKKNNDLLQRYERRGPRYERGKQNDRGVIEGIV